MSALTRSLRPPGAGGRSPTLMRHRPLLWATKTGKAHYPGDVFTLKTQQNLKFEVQEESRIPPPSAGDEQSPGSPPAGTHAQSVPAYPDFVHRWPRNPAPPQPCPPHSYQDSGITSPLAFLPSFGPASAPSRTRPQ